MKGPDHTYRGLFDYSRPQQLALGLVGLLILLCVGAGKWYPFEPPGFTADAALVAQAKQFHQARVDELSALRKTPESFLFDPNTVSEMELLRLGLRPDQARSWLRYRGNRSSTFKRKSDIAKLYKLDSTDVARLLPLIRIADRGANEVAAPVVDSETKEPVYESFTFDPNTVTKEELQRLGLSEKRAEGFLKFRKKAKPFRSAADLDKLRLLTDELKTRLKPLVRIATSGPVIASNDAPVADGAVGPSTYGGVVTPQPYEAYEDVPLASVDINLATSLGLQEIRGIGPYWGDRIVKYRETLGGFSSIDQLATMYGFPDSTFQAVKPYLRYETMVLRKLKINALSSEALAKHPVLKFKQARAIVNYRNNHGPFRNLEDLKAVKILKATDLQLLGPYLDFSE